MSSSLSVVQNNIYRQLVGVVFCLELAFVIKTVEK